MRKCFCDACGIETKDINIFDVPCHLYSMKARGQYADTEGNHISGRRDSVDLCNKCSNLAYTAALKEINLP